jgi:hypothetical protein
VLISNPFITSDETYKMLIAFF